VEISTTPDSEGATVIRPDGTLDRAEAIKSLQQQIRLLDLQFDELIELRRASTTLEDIAFYKRACQDVKSTIMGFTTVINQLKGI
jgi:hypothetical protein